MQWVCFFLFLTVCLSIQLPMSTNQRRTMVIFTYVSGDSVKLYLKLPQVSNQKDYQKWYITIENSETMEREQKTIAYGIFKEQIFTSQSSIYNLHIEFKGDDRQEKILVDFESHLNFNVNPKAIVIPDSLPKSKEIRKTYKQVAQINELGEKFSEIQNKRKAVEEELFSKTTAVNGQLIFILRAQVFLLISMMVLQLCVFSKWAKQNQKQ